MFTVTTSTGLSQCKDFHKLPVESSIRAYQNNQPLASFTHGAPLSINNRTEKTIQQASNHFFVDTQQNEATTLGSVIAKIILELHKYCPNLDIYNWF